MRFQPTAASTSLVNEFHCAGDPVLQNDYIIQALDNVVITWFQAAPSEHCPLIGGRQSCLGHSIPAFLELGGADRNRTDP